MEPAISKNVLFVPCVFAFQSKTGGFQAAEHASSLSIVESMFVENKFEAFRGNLDSGGPQPREHLVALQALLCSPDNT